MLTYEAERNEARKSAKRGWWSWVLVGVLAAALLYVLFKKKKITIWRVLPDSFAYSAMAPVPDLILLRRDVIPSDRLIRHERIHHAQQRELFLIGFWIWYLLEFVVRLIVTRSWPKAYRQISFEAEAAKFQFGGTRKPFGWINFL